MDRVSLHTGMQKHKIHPISSQNDRRVNITTFQINKVNTRCWNSVLSDSSSLLAQTLWQLNPWLSPYLFIAHRFSVDKQMLPLEQGTLHHPPRFEGDVSIILYNYPVDPILSLFYTEHHESKCVWLEIGNVWVPRLSDTVSSKTQNFSLIPLRKSPLLLMFVCLQVLFHGAKTKPLKCPEISLSQSQPLSLLDPPLLELQRTHP